MDHTLNLVLGLMPYDHALGLFFSYHLEIHGNVHWDACLGNILNCVMGFQSVTSLSFEDLASIFEELKKLGADIKVVSNTAFIGGTKPGRIALTGGRVRAADLRGGAALVLAGMAASGITEVENIAQIDRGYERFEEKLLLLGADVKRETEAAVSNLHPVLLA
ncbi:hypothetical protein MA16_Dca011647 [Dendrobium catenatum]|uniref:UDP-N-acetylglucosamine 1-carboxyvinyltransferase n=1 Tax=Dendrobium catenatum TaxID=906689 RepID=A0A2I0WQU7_9ASPA|nr:hypothetical protein MA16_Dca011647 [Dendrobium catenatum]